MTVPQIERGSSADELIEVWERKSGIANWMLKAAIPRAIDAVYTARDTDHTMHEAGAAAAVTTLRAIVLRDLIGEGGPKPSVNGRCPMGCGETLVLNDLAKVVCVNPDCPDAEMLDKVISHEALDKHVVILDDEGFSIQHPLSERLTDMTECDVHKAMQEQDGPPAPDGRYYIAVESRAHDGYSDSHRSGQGGFTLRLNPVEPREGQATEIIVDEA